MWDTKQNVGSHVQETEVILRQGENLKKGRGEVWSLLSVGPFNSRGHRPVEQTLGDRNPHP